ncbi:MAG: putative HTH-type transcriptional regulator [Methanonatronarchaeales archaeon]|nr:putative HTH-type transcriptional regulator [Methanonatronarchaeales archaeon]
MTTGSMTDGGLCRGDEELLMEVQDGIPLVEEPWREVGERLGMSEGDVVERLERLMDDGVIRRIGASIVHHSVGYEFNAMGVWKVPEEEAEGVGKKMTSFDFVTHCYERPVFPGRWEYNLFTMVHGRSREECEEKIEKLAEATGVEDYEMIYSTREFKKTGVKLPE